MAEPTPGASVAPRGAGNPVHAQAEKLLPHRGAVTGATSGAPRLLRARAAGSDRALPAAIPAPLLSLWCCCPGLAAAMKDVPGFLQQSQSSGPGPAAVWHRLEELYTKK